MYMDNKECGCGHDHDEAHKHAEHTDEGCCGGHGHDGECCKNEHGHGRITTEELTQSNNIVINALIDTLIEKGVITEDKLKEKIQLMVEAYEKHHEDNQSPEEK